MTCAHIRSCLTALLCLAAISCGLGRGCPETLIRLVYLPGATEYKSIFWLDNDRVFIPGHTADEPLSSKAGIFIFDTRNNTYQRFADLEGGRSAWFCYYDGFISYPVISDDEKVHQKEGRMGQERQVPDEETELAPGENHGYTICKKIDRTRRLRPEHIALEKDHFPVGASFLRDQDGYIFSGYCKERYCGGKGRQDEEFYDDPARLYRPGHDTPLELPIRNKELALGSFVRYSEWANKYVIVPSSRRDTPYRSGYSLDGQVPYQVYLFSPEGSVEAIPLKDGPWLPPGNAALTKAGLFVAANNGSSIEDGGWLAFPDGRRQRLYSGITLASGVSPDGCKLAYVAANSKDNLTHILDFCGGHRE